jgi:hypothetical protein
MKGLIVAKRFEYKLTAEKIGYVRGFSLLYVRLGNKHWDGFRYSTYPHSHTVELFLWNKKIALYVDHYKNGRYDANL